MGLVEIDTSNPDLFKPMEFKVPPKGKYLLEVGNDLVVEQSKSSDNHIVKAELRVQDDGEFKGSVIYDNFVIIADTSTEKGRTSKRINEARLCQFAVACGVRTQEEINEGKGIPLDEFKGKVCEAITKVVNYKDPNTDETRTKAAIVRYLFEPEN